MLIPFYLITLLDLSFYILLLTGVVIFIRMIQKKMINLLGLVLFFILYAIQTNPPTFLPEYLVFTFAYITPFSLVFFIKFTFYRNRKSTFPFIIASLVVLIILEILLKLSFQFQPGFAYPSNPNELPFFIIYIVVRSLQWLVVMVWYSISVFRSYSVFRKIDIPAWLKVRYLLVGISTLIFSIDTSLSILLIINDFNVILFLIYASIVDVLLFTAVNVVAWAIPFKALIQFFNREPRETLEDVKEIEVLEKVKSELKRDNPIGNSKLNG
ncbi:MAG: hypothetical protein EAX91_18010 [Candidatus Lokiarchaeota archaeon]|nr:hypothetical protein [Candidatus Lokiarchaeota archaeon]